MARGEKGRGRPAAALTSQIFHAAAVGCKAYIYNCPHVVKPCPNVLYPPTLFVCPPPLSTLHDCRRKCVRESFATQLAAPLHGYSQSLQDARLSQLLDDGPPSAEETGACSERNADPPAAHRGDAI